MIVAVSLSIAFAMGIDPRRLMLLGMAVYAPLLIAGLVTVHWLRSRSGEENGSVAFCEAVAAELRSGATLRDALIAAAAASGSRIASTDDASAPISEVARQVAAAFPSIEQELLLTVTASAHAGSDAASLFDEIGSLAIAQAEVRREVRVATAPGKATAAVLVGAPVIYLLVRLGSTGVAEYLATAQQRVVAITGLGLFTLGLAVTGLVLWRAVR